MMFDCENCGCCCRNLDKSDLYASLDRGDGVCRFLRGNDCSIYADRPLLCRIDECYDLLFSDVMTREEYYRMNKQVCERLKELEG